MSEDVDALFIEGREDVVKPEKWSIGYIVFLIGTFLIFWLQDLIDREDLEETVDIPIYDEIDTQLPVLYQRISPIGSMAAGAFCGGIWLFGLAMPFFPFPLIPVPDWIVIVYSLVVRMLIISFVPVLFSFLMIFTEERYIGGRDDDMVESIEEISSENGYHTVVVSCGESHVKGISERFEARGWDVEPHYSDTLLARLWRRVG